MKTRTILAALLLAFSGAASSRPAAPATPAVPGEAAVRAAKHAVSAYRDDVVDTLAKLVSYNTVADKDIPGDRNPQHIGFKNFLKAEAARLGLDFADEGYVVVIGLGPQDAQERVGMIAHGDVQPVDPSKWKKSPFELDRTSEPGKLLARGAEDDKGPIATALYAMKSLKDLQLPLSKRIELYVYMAEESDWAPLEQFVKTHTLPQLNITLDAEYPAVTAERGYGTVSMTFPASSTAVPADQPSIAQFGGGFFGSQIPEDAQALVANVTPALEARIKQRAGKQADMHYSFERKGKDLAIVAKGVSAHSSKPEDGLNAISMLADALAVGTWPDTPSGALVNFLNEMVGTGFYGEKFGSIAYRDAFMGPMTFAPTVIKQTAQGPQLAINIRRPQGKTGQQLSNEINAALAQWQGAHQLQLLDTKVLVTDPWIAQDAPQLPVLMKVFSYFTGVKDPKPIAIGGGTNSRLFPRAVSFGPAMPHTVYTGHSEHEFITLKQLLLNLEMYTAALAELAQ
jgi:dipeptidase D